MPSSDNFLFDLAGQFFSGISVDLHTTFAALLLFGFIIFGIFLLQSVFYGRDSEESDSESSDMSSVDYRRNAWRSADSGKERRRSCFDDDHNSNRPGWD